MADLTWIGQIMTSQEVADALRISTGRLRNMRARHRQGHRDYDAGPPVHQMGEQRVVYHRQEVERWIEMQIAGNERVSQPAVARARRARRSKGLTSA